MNISNIKKLMESDVEYLIKEFDKLLSNYFFMYRLDESIKI